MHNDKKAMKTLFSGVKGAGGPRTPWTREKCPPPSLNAAPDPLDLDLRHIQALMLELILGYFGYLVSSRGDTGC